MGSESHIFGNPRTARHPATWRTCASPEPANSEDADGTSARTSRSPCNVWNRSPES